MNESKFEMVKMTCPYCGNTRFYKMKDQSHLPHVYFCYPEEGGCDRYFVASVKFTPQVKVSKIEGD
jgi:DNA-directed RNA polymerase subunit RPC12/RpoP